MRNEILKMSMVVFAIGLLSFFVLSCGGSSGGGDGDGGDGDAAIDNSIFFGEFAVQFKIDSCGIDTGIITVGDDVSKKDEDGYVYVPKDTNSATFSEVDDDGDPLTLTITVSGDTVIIDEDGQWQGDPSKGWTTDIELAYSNSYNDIDISGSQTDDDPEECQGAVSGSAIRVGTVGVSIDGYSLQYRNFENAASNRYRGWISLTKDGIPGEVSDFTKVELKNSAGTVVNEPVDVNNLYPGSYYWGQWNNSTNSVDFSGPYVDSGYSIRFPAGDLLDDNYTYEVTTSEGDIISDTFNFPGKEELPFVQSASMSHEWLPDDSLRLTWINPVVIDYDQLRIYIWDEDAGVDVAYINLPTDVDEVTIPAEWIEIMGDFYDLNSVWWQVQTRSNTNEGLNYARGYSSGVQIQD